MSRKIKVQVVGTKKYGFWWRLESLNGQCLGTSAEKYTRKYDAYKAARRITTAFLTVYVHGRLA